MNTYQVTTYEEEYHRYTYTVQANSPEEAEEKVKAGGIDYENDELVSGEIISVEVEVK